MGGLFGEVGTEGLFAVIVRGEAVDQTAGRRRGRLVAAVHLHEAKRADVLLLCRPFKCQVLGIFI